MLHEHRAIPGAFPCIDPAFSARISALFPVSRFLRPAAVRRFAAVLLGCACAAIASAQPAVAVAPEAGKGGKNDLDWKALVAHATTGDEKLEPAADETSRRTRRNRLATDFVAIADEAAKFLAEHPQDARTGPARVIQARNLLKAALVGDQAQRDQAFALAGAIETNPNFSRSERFDVAFLREQVVVRGQARNRADYFAACEASARRLIAAYGDLAGGYEWLLGTAEGTRDDQKLRAVAAEIQQSPAPFQAKARATIVTERFDLIGKSLADLANTALGRDNLFERTRNRRTLVYTWDLRSLESVARAVDIEKNAPRGVLVIGVCLDPDVKTARGVAAQMGLDAPQYYDEAGAGCFLAMRLKLHSPHLIYLTDDRGRISNVTAREDNLAALLQR